MRRSCLLPATMVLAGVAAAQGDPEPPDETGLEDIVVTARPGALPPLRDAIEYFRTHCFDASRLSRQLAPPVDDRDWQPLDEATRRQFGVGDSDVPAFGLADPLRNRTLLLKFERFSQPDRLTENRCTLVLIGGQDHAALVGQMSALFHGQGTQRHVGHPDGVPGVRGWRHWVWTGMPQRVSRNWRVVRPARPSGGGAWLVVTDPRFYDNYDYILGDLKIRHSGRPLSVLTFAFTTRAQ